MKEEAKVDDCKRVYASTCGNGCTCDDITDNGESEAMPIDWPLDEVNFRFAEKI